MNKPTTKSLLMLIITLLAFAVRIWHLDSAPPGYSDDELSNGLVLSQKILNGEWRVYFTDASGHETLFHIWVAGTMALFGRNLIGFRLVSIILGTLSVPLTYQVGRRLFHANIGLVAAGALAFSFWGLHYSRINQRHIAMPFFLLLTFAAFWTAQQRSTTNKTAWPWFVGAGLTMGAGFYTYFASRGVPLILFGFLLYALVMNRPLFQRVWRGTLATIGISLLMAIPLAISVQSQDGGDARVTELALPINEAREGNYAVLGEYVVETLGMFHATGDPEFLYNIPNRPVFGLPLGILFWVGVLVAVALALSRWIPFISIGNKRYEAAAIFLLGWWLTGISPGFMSVPPASHSHTIAAQSATFILFALPLLLFDQTVLKRMVSPLGQRRLSLLLAVILIGAVSMRELPAYFQTWPERGQTRFLFHADQQDVGRYLATAPELTQFGITSLLFGPWDREALMMETGRFLPDDSNIHARWYNPQRAILLAIDDQPAINFHAYPRVDELYAALYEPALARVGGYTLSTVRADAVPSSEPMTCFANGLCLVGIDFQRDAGYVDVTWRAERPLDLPPQQLVSKPPPPHIDDGPRLFVFVQLLDLNGQFVAGDDGLWVEAATLKSGDIFRQRHWLSAGEAASQLAIGLYDPTLGVRILTITNEDAFTVQLVDLP